MILLNKSFLHSNIICKMQVQLPPPPPHSQVPPMAGVIQSDGAVLSTENKNSLSSQEIPKMVAGHPPP